MCQIQSPILQSFTKIEIVIVLLPDLSEINSEEMDSNNDFDEVETFHMDVSHVARAGSAKKKAGGKY